MNTGAEGAEKFWGSILEKAPPLAKSPPLVSGGRLTRGGAFCKWGSLVRCAAGENFEIWDLFFIDFPLEITFLESQNLKIFACGAYEHEKVLWSDLNLSKMNTGAEGAENFWGSILEKAPPPCFGGSANKGGLFARNRTDLMAPETCGTCSTDPNYYTPISVCPTNSSWARS